MKTLPAGAVHELWLQMNLLDVADVEKLGLQFYTQQPHVCDFVVNQGVASDFSENERQLLLYLSIGIWQMVREALPEKFTPKEVPPAALGEADMLNQLLFEEADEARWKLLIDDHVQPAIMRKIKQVVEGEGLELPVLPENRLAMMRTLTTVLDCLTDDEN